jgi:hypothetical protein
MSVQDDLRAIAHRAHRELDSVHDFFEHSKIVWRSFQILVDEGHRIIADNLATRTRIDQDGLDPPGAAVHAGLPVHIHFPAVRIRARGFPVQLPSPRPPAQPLGTTGEPPVTVSVSPLALDAYGNRP